MIGSKKHLIVLGFFLVLQACTQIDNYMLGKDNTPTPTPLDDLKPSLTLVENWSVSMGKPGKTSSNLKLKPYIHDHIIYAASASGMVQAMETETGHVLWSKQLNHQLISGPTVANGYIALGTNRSKVMLLNQQDGSEVREFKVSGDALSKPAMVGNKLIIKTIDGYLYAFDLKTGTKLWASEHGSPSLILKASSSPIIMGKMVLVGFSDGKLDAIDLETGHTVWQRSIAYASGSSDVERLVDIDADPIVRDGTVYLASYQGYVGALSIENGEFNWQKPASVYKNMAIDSTTLYMTDSDDVLWAFNRSNGQVKWKQLAFKARGLTDPTLLGNRLVVGDRTGFVHVLSSLSGEVLSRTKLSGSIDIAPAVAGNSVYVMTANGKLSRFSVS
jgi:outer membrane protein assembly factor BamB